MTFRECFEIMNSRDDMKYQVFLRKLYTIYSFCFPKVLAWEQRRMERKKERDTIKKHKKLKGCE